MTQDPDHPSSHFGSEPAPSEQAPQTALIGAALLMIVFLILPTIGLGARAFASPASVTALLDRPVVSAITLSLGTTAISLVLTFLLGAPLAFWLARFEFPLRRLVSTLVELPIVLPPVVAGLGLLLVFGRRGLLGGALAAAGIALPFTSAAVVMAQVFVSAPLFIRAAQARFSAVPRDLEDAAMIDGADRWLFFRYVAIPLSAPGLLAGLTLAWARALGEFGATILFAGSLQGRTQTMPLLVYQALESDLNEALWVALLLAGVALAALLLSRWLGREWEEVAHVGSV